MVRLTVRDQAGPCSSHVATPPSQLVPVQVFPTMLPHAIGTAGGPAEIRGIFDRDARRGHQDRDEPSAADHRRGDPDDPRAPEAWESSPVLIEVTS